MTIEKSARKPGAQAESAAAPPPTTDLPSEPGVGAPTAFVISSQVAGFRRAGRAWSTAPETVPADELSAAQIAALRADPMLVVEPIFGSE